MAERLVTPFEGSCPPGPIRKDLWVQDEHDHHPGGLSLRVPLLGALSSRLASLLVDAALRRRMGAAGRDIVSDHEFDATLDAFEGIYTRVLDRAEPAVGRAA